MGKWGTFAKKYAQSIIALVMAMVVAFFVLNLLAQKFSGNIVGKTANTIGARASGQSYHFS